MIIQIKIVFNVQSYDNTILRCSELRNSNLNSLKILFVHLELNFRSNVRVSPEKNCQLLDIVRIFGDHIKEFERSHIAGIQFKD